MAMMIAPFFFNLCTSVADENKKNKKVFYCYVSFALLNAVLMNTTSFYVKGLWSFGVFKYQPLGGYLYPLFTIFFHWCTVHGFWIVLRSFMNSSEDKKRKQLGLFLIATAASYSGGALLFVQAFYIPFPSYGVFPILTYVILTGYAIHKYQFLDFPSLLRTKEVIEIHRDKLALIGLLASSVSHELKNPLFLIQEYIRKTSEVPAVSNDPEARESVSRLSQQTDRIDKLVKRLNDFSKPYNNRSPANEVNLSEAIENALFFASQELKYHNISTVINIDPALPKVRGDRGEFEEIFLNLIVNAFHAMPDGGKLTIDSHTTNDGKGIEISIQDTGSGIPPEQLGNIFKPFYTTKTKTGGGTGGASGTGLGLYIVKNLVEKNGGVVKVLSEIKNGSQFTLKFNSV